MELRPRDGEGLDPVDAGWRLEEEEGRGEQPHVSARTPATPPLSRSAARPPAERGRPERAPRATRAPPSRSAARRRPGRASPPAAGPAPRAARPARRPIAGRRPPET